MGLETIVRPVTSKDFRPTAKRSLPPTDDNPVSFDGGTGRLIDLNHSANYSWSHTVERETERTYDTLRIHNPDDSSQFVDDEVITKIRYRNWDGNIRKVRLTDPPEQDNIEIISRDNTRSNSD